MGVQSAFDPHYAPSRGPQASFAELNRDKLRELRLSLERRKRDLDALQARLDRSPRADPLVRGVERDYGFDTAFREATKPFFQFLFDTYWRVDVTGMESVPPHGGAILIGNHSGGIPFDATMVAFALSERRSPGRIARLLYDKFVEGLPLIASFYRKCGGVPARYAIADELLTRDQVVTIFPEGTLGPAKLYDQRYRLRPFATSAARLSLKHRVPIVPFAVIGAEEIYPVIGRSTQMGKALGVPYVPITPFFPAFGLLGLIPLPSKWTIVFGSPIYLYREARFRGRAGRDFSAMAERLRVGVQALVDRTLAKRVSIFLG